jgi:O-antigen ligase
MRRIASFAKDWYFAAVMTLWVISPGLRRIVDWLTSFHKVSVFSVLPLVLMLPGLFFVASRWNRLGSLYRTVATFWLIGFAYAFVIGICSGAKLSALYDLVTFVFPILFGLFLVSSRRGLPATYERSAKTILWLAAIVSVYAIYQYISPPAWDVFWVQNSDLASIGQPVPFGLRVFGTLNSYATFASFLSLTLVMNLPRLRRSARITALLFVPCLLALLLTLDRTSWLALALGTIVYLVASPERGRAARTLTSIALSGALLGGVLLAVTAGSQDVGTNLTDRLSTLTELSEDTSVASRQAQTAAALHDGLTEPLGQGLGAVGTSSVAGASGSTATLDNGYLARFLEMGFWGFGAYLIAIVAAFWGTFSAYRQGTRLNGITASMLAMTLAVQCMFLGLELASDAHNSLLGVLFWATLSFTSRAGEPLSAGAPAHTPFVVASRPAQAS